MKLLRRKWRLNPLLILTMALGIGANAAVYSIVHAVLLKPLPFRDPQRLVALWAREIHAKGTSKLFDLYTDYENLKAPAHSFDQVAAITWAGGLDRILTGRGPARSVLAMPASADFFALTGVPAELGRTFESDDEARGCSVVLSHSFWR